MKLLRLPALALLLLASSASALTVSGSVTGALPAGARVGVFALGTGGAPGAELGSAPITGGRFSLTLTAAPPQSALYALTPGAVLWPGVLEPVNVSGQASVTDARLYVYADANGSGARDDGEPLLDTVPERGNVLLLEWASAQARVTAARGFDAPLSAGWNALLVSVGRTVRVTPASSVTLNVQR